MLGDRRVRAPKLVVQWGVWYKKRFCAGTSGLPTGSEAGCVTGVYGQSVLPLTRERAKLSTIEAARPATGMAQRPTGTDEARGGAGRGGAATASSQIRPDFISSANNRPLAGVQSGSSRRGD